jgi:DNA ligase-associated metallophosphoesterase
VRDLNPPPAGGRSASKARRVGAGSGPTARPRLASGDPPLALQGRGEVTVAGITLLADCVGALFWAEEGALIVADLHLEKGSAFAKRGVLLPPYDTAATLGRLAALIERYAPRLVVALGDNFHDGGGPARMAEANRTTLAALQRGRDWIWLLGNHDPDPSAGIGGRFAQSLALGALMFRHQPSSQASEGEIAGHLHPCARITQRGRAVSRRCFAGDGRRLVMPAFGAYAGGLNVRDRAILGLFGAASFTAYMLGERRVYAVPAARCLSD